MWGNFINAVQKEQPKFLSLFSFVLPVNLGRSQSTARYKVVGINIAASSASFIIVGKLHQSKVGLNSNNILTYNKHNLTNILIDQKWQKWFLGLRTEDIILTIFFLCFLNRILKWHLIIEWRMLLQTCNIVSSSFDPFEEDWNDEVVRKLYSLICKNTVSCQTAECWFQVCLEQGDKYDSLLFTSRVKWQ